MPTFIAVRCFQCSTMQVKQQKKSGNKWSCVVCNEKQSVRKVFAESVAAKDVRLFVQNFNMSRQLSDQKQVISEEELQTSDPPTNKPKVMKSRRTDWTEYIDDDTDDRYEVSGKGLEDEKLTQGDGFNPMVVTEMPKPLFKKPKLKGNPWFPSRSNANTRHGNDQTKANLQLMNEFGETNCERGANTKTSHFGIRMQDKKSNFVQQTITAAADRAVHVVQEDTSDATGLAEGPISKWNSFITEDDDDYHSQRERLLGDCENEDKSDALVSLMMNVNDERVEDDDIHPDFL